MEDEHDVLALAQKHGLELDPESVRINEAGLDYRDAIGRARDGGGWVLRIPRRSDVVQKAAQ
jgi:macrolide phosphotransferase